MTEQKYQKKIADKLTKEGWFVMKLMKTNINGIPDLLALKKGKEPFFIEVKGVDGKPSKLQEYRIRQLNELGFKAIIDYAPEV